MSGCNARQSALWPHISAANPAGAVVARVPERLPANEVEHTLAPQTAYFRTGKDRLVSTESEKEEQAKAGSTHF